MKVLVILVLGGASNSATVSSYEGLPIFIPKLHLVALIILVLARASNSATVSDYEGFKFCMQKMRRVALIILVHVVGRRPP